MIQLDGSPTGFNEEHGILLLAISIVEYKSNPLDYQSPMAALPRRHAHSVSSMKRAGQPSGGAGHAVKFRIASQKQSALALLG